MPSRGVRVDDAVPAHEERIVRAVRDEEDGAVAQMVQDGRLSLDGLITHTATAADAPRAYEQAFEDPACLKMVLDWRNTA